MKKWVYIVSVVAIIIVAILMGKMLYNRNKDKINVAKNDNINNEQIVQEKNYNVKNDIAIQTNTEEEKVSPNAVLVLKKVYNECKHTIKQYAEIPQEFVNLTKGEIQKEYLNWKIEKFTPLEITLVKEEQGSCGEHYNLKEKDGMIAVYKIEKEGKETLVEETGISMDYLTESDKIKIKEGIKVYGKEELNSTLEDYE